MAYGDSATHAALISKGVPPASGFVLAHVVQNKVEAAYARCDLFERRRRLMHDWAEYLAGKGR